MTARAADEFTVTRAIIGIDTSLRSTGIGVLGVEGTRMKALHMQVVKNPRALPHSGCLLNIRNALEACLEQYHPAAAAIEGGFFMKNARTALVLGESRGVVIASCAGASVPVYEYAPRKVKQSLVGFGGAHKDQVARMVATLLNLERPPPDDAADALAMAICHVQQSSSHPALAQESI